MAEKEKKSNSFLTQGAILGAASIVVRIIGLIYRVPLNNILGEKGIAYYGVAYDVYSILLILSSYSMPLAVSKMVSSRVSVGRYKDTKKIFHASILFALCLGVAAAAITFFGADLFAKILNYPQSAVAIRVLAPCLIIMSVLGVMRGFFQGLGTMVPTAISNIVEQIINAVVSIVAAYSLFNMAFSIEGAEESNLPESYGAAGGTLGTVMGALSGLIFLFILYLVYRRTFNKKAVSDTKAVMTEYKDIIRVLVVTIIPVIISTTIYNVGSIIDTGLFSNIMAAKGIDQDTIETLTGMYTGNYKVIINVPIALASALASSLIPSIVASVTRKENETVISKIRFAVKVTMIIAMPCAVGIGVLAKPIIMMLFPTSVDPDKVALMLMVGCISVIFYSLSTISNSMLQGIDKMRLPVIHSAIALGVRIVLIIAALYLTGANIFCIIICDTIFALIICILNHHSLKKHLNYKQEVRQSFILPAVCSVIMGVITFFVYRLFHMLIGSNTFAVITSIIIAVIVYMLALIFLKVISADELRSIPGGTRLLRLLRKVHLL